MDMSPEAGTRRRSPQLILGWVALAVLVVASGQLFVMTRRLRLPRRRWRPAARVRSVLELRTRKARPGSRAQPSRRAAPSAVVGPRRRTTTCSCPSACVSVRRTAPPSAARRMELGAPRPRRRRASGPGSASDTDVHSARSGGFGHGPRRLGLPLEALLGPSGSSASASSCRRATRPATDRRHRPSRPSRPRPARAGRRGPRRRLALGGRHRRRSPAPPGATVVRQGSVLPEFGDRRGKGEAMWKALAVAERRSPRLPRRRSRGVRRADTSPACSARCCSTTG